MRRLTFALQSGFWAGVVLWTGVIFYLSTLPGPPGPAPTSFTIGDKIQHLEAFSLGGFLLAGALRLTWRHRLVWTMAVAVLALSVYGVLDEVHQIFTPLRNGADAWDAVANTVGAFLGAGLFCLVQLGGRRLLSWNGNVGLR